MESISHVAVIGAGIMGAGIAQACAQSGFRVCLMDVDELLAQRAVKAAAAGMKAFVDKGLLTDEKAEAALRSITCATSLEEAVEGADLVIEAVPENMDLKRKIFADLDGMTSAQCILATNTSSLSVGGIGATTAKPDKVIGLHFFYPVPVSPTVEIVPSLDTSQETIDISIDFCRGLGKETLLAKDFPGFVTNRLLSVLANEAFDLLWQGLAEPEEIDRACTTIFGHPIGPLKMADALGLDTVQAVLDYLHREMGERYRPSPLLKQLVYAGKLGRKSGSGVFDYGS